MPQPRTQDIINSKTINEAPSTLVNRFEYNGDSTVLYAGYAPRGSATSDDVWTIFKYTYSSQLVTLKQTAFDSWDNRATASYS